eukprot:GHVU01007518.1.p1 GENE.GHVU01007518.1~~GHVU01007518.1.p1  ORF type:complete len:155 (+),score=4.89 GHVU01007518.1:1033-1497(+)
MREGRQSVRNRAKGRSERCLDLQANRQTYTEIHARGRERFCMHLSLKSLSSPTVSMLPPTPLSLFVRIICVSVAVKGITLGTSAAAGALGREGVGTRPDYCVRAAPALRTNCRPVRAPRVEADVQTRESSESSQRTLTTVNAAKEDDDGGHRRR